MAAKLEEYERVRMPEVKALVRLCRVANPYQYRQTGRVSAFRQRLWAVNFLLRMPLAKVPGLSANAFFSMQGEKSYAKIMRRCDRTTLLLAGVGATAAWNVWRVFRRFLL